MTLPEHNRNVIFHPGKRMGFIPIPKGVSGSITEALRENRFQKLETGEVKLKGAYLFTLVRHPIYRYVSAYMWATKPEWQPHKAGRLPREEYLELFRKRTLGLGSVEDIWNVHLYPQHMFMKDREGRWLPISDRFRMEELNDGVWRLLKKKLRIPQKHQLKHRHRTRAPKLKKRVEEVLFGDERLFSKVRELYEEDLELYFSTPMIRDIKK